MPLEVKQFSCPKCAAALDIKTAGRSKSIVCSSCGSQIDLTGPDYQILGTVGTRPAPKVTQFAIGMKGTISAQEYEIIGRVVYRGVEGDIWDEWLLLSAAGEFVWISDSENEGMAIWYSFVPGTPFEPDTLTVGRELILHESWVTVRDKSSANIDYLEGELTWKARVNDRMNYVEADGITERISIEYTEHEVEFYWGRTLDSRATAQSFILGITAPGAYARPRSFYGDSASYGSGDRGGKSGAQIVIIIVVAVIIIAAALSGGGGSGDSSGISIRSGSSSSHSIGGGSGVGGGSGGK